MTWLLTGGAGYIGAHVVRSLLNAGLECVVIDDLSTGVSARLPDRVPLVQSDIHERETMRKVMREHEVGGVIHLAAKKSPAHSVADPLHYYFENVGGLEATLRAMVETKVRRLVLSSSASVYGAPAVTLVDEDAPLAPINPYGSTKAVCEQLVREACAAYGISATILRYFNVAGAGEPSLGDEGVFNLVPLALRAVARGERPVVFGTDYPTPDGTGVRDYIHVADLADAHAIAAARLDAAPASTHRAGPSIYNVGRGEGVSVLEVLAAVREVTGREVSPMAAPRRPGDPASVIGDVERIRRDFGWSADRDLRQIVASAWASLQAATIQEPVDPHRSSTEPTWDCEGA